MCALPRRYTACRTAAPCVNMGGRGASVLAAAAGPASATKAIAMSPIAVRDRHLRFRRAAPAFWSLWYISFSCFLSEGGRSRLHERSSSSKHDRAAETASTRPTSMDSAMASDPSTGLGSTINVYPAVKRWAIFDFPRVKLRFTPNVPASSSSACLVPPPSLPAPVPSVPLW